MKRKNRSKRTRLRAQGFALAVVLVVFVVAVFGPVVKAGKKWRYSLEPPVTLDFDMEDIAEPEERERSYYYDFLYSTFGLQVKEGLDFPRNFRKLAGKPKQAYNVNVLGEVPDSSWFTNRNAERQMTLEEIRRGPNLGSGPAPGPWKVIQGKTEGITPGFLIRDSAGEIYQLKFDPPEFPEMATAAEVIDSKLYHGAGYNVKENYIVVFLRERLVMDPEAGMLDRYGRKSRMTAADVEGILSRVPRSPDGRYRAVAGKYLPGIAKGPFAFEGVRKDDPNDWIPHEHRRDLRGLRIFCSWVNENDMREGNTLDMYVEEGGRRFLRHYIIDLGSSLGSETNRPNPDRIGNEYILDGGEIFKSALSLGIYRRPWEGTGSASPHPAVGFLEAEIFDPGRWKANYPILPFENMTLRDAFWGTKLVLSFTDEQIRTAIETGEFSDPAATELLTRVMIQRRDKIGRYWLNRVNPLDRFTVSRGADGELQLRFVDLTVYHDFVSRQDRSYEFTIREESNPSRVLRRKKIEEPVITLPELGQEEGKSAGLRVYQVSIRTFGARGKALGKVIHVYLVRQLDTDSVDVVGIERTD